ncbi:hypothetical protein CSA37_01235 [Candidatus Fermentibacteria bacterium]|nr:MAG: hypothetical protein CSA37_13485 [Candidatus Fermentibacteria bacterium]PIE51911.1 MAG: hypothetical protein CSA37_09020 [Candidatus Fermentibacteria bacterium]PIE53473.1 MAG: hypothetical protein CSA37_01235 [Candidatus Fermentibacteria bacterium]
MQNAIAGAMNGSSLHILLGASFLFGLLHALGPGHRKGILITYFLGEGYAPVKGMAAVHALSAVLLVGGFFFLTTRPLSTSVNTTHNILMMITWALILAIGIWMLLSGLRHSQSGKSKGFKALIASGAVPCPGASAIMILAVFQKAYVAGMISVLAMSQEWVFFWQ